MENLYLIKDLGALAGRDYRAKEIQNLQRIEQFALGLTTEFKLHQKAKKFNTSLSKFIIMVDRKQQ